MNPIAGSLPDSDAGTSTSTSNLSSDNSLGISYKFNNGMSLGPVANWNWKMTGGQDLTLVDPFLKLGLGSEYKNGPLSVGGDLRYYVPVTEKSRKAGLIGVVRTTQVASIAIPNSPISFDLPVIPYVYFFSTFKPGNRMFRLIGAPQVNYSITDAVTPYAAFIFDSAVRKAAAGEASKGLTLDGHMVDVGVSWDVIPGLNLCPYIEIPTSAPVVSLETTNLNLSLSWKIM